MDKNIPIITRTPTADGFEITMDYGSQGCSRGSVHIKSGTPDEAAANRRALDHVLARYGYKIKE